MYRNIGLGDVIHTVATTLGIKEFAGCGCKYRRELLNKWFPRIAVV